MVELHHNVGTYVHKTQNTIEGAYRPFTIGPVEAGPRPSLEDLFAPPPPISK